MVDNDRPVLLAVIRKSINAAIWPMSIDAAGMRGYRSRNLSGPLRVKRNDTHMGTIEKQYDADFGVRSDMHLRTYLEQHNIASLNDLIHKNKNQG